MFGRTIKNIKFILLHVDLRIVRRLGVMATMRIFFPFILSLSLSRSFRLIFISNLLHFQLRLKYILFQRHTTFINAFLTIYFFSRKIQRNIMHFMQCMQNFFYTIVAQPIWAKHIDMHKKSNRILSFLFACVCVCVVFFLLFLQFGLGNRRGRRFFFLLCFIRHSFV